VTDIDFTLTGCANGHPVRIEARGRLPAIEFVVADGPFTFCRLFAHFAGLDAVAALARGLVVAHDDALVARCRADFLTEGGVDVGSLVAQVAVQRVDGRLRCAAQLATARVAFEVGERVTSIAEREVRAVPCRGGVALFSTAAISTSRGHDWTVIASAHVLGCGPGKRRTLLLPAS
jgi:hypothetical protein